MYYIFNNRTQHPTPEVTRAERGTDMTFNVNIIYRVGGTTMTKESSGIEKIERAFDRYGDKEVEVIRFYETAWNWFTFKADAVLNINMIPEM